MIVILAPYSILVVEDRASIAMDIAENFLETGIEVIMCRSILDADLCWEDNKDKIDAIVLDIMMSPYGLPNNLRELTHEGLITGWIWLWYALNPSNDIPHPVEGKTVILYSGYLGEDLQDYFSNLSENDLQKRFFEKSVIKVNKGESDSLVLLKKVLMHEKSTKAVHAELHSTKDVNEDWG